mmetsp:Transcript_31363/g.59642  ORF Transcript_31363/g.59642 Transcript_31363/m.59642 type:complete len:386 (+) Transcript_31363:362-1519(+)
MITTDKKLITYIHRSTMATTSRILTGLNRKQIHQHHRSVQYYTSQFDYYAQSFQTFQTKRASSSSSAAVASVVTSSQFQLRHERRPLVTHYQNPQWQHHHHHHHQHHQQQQNRYLSDHLKQRAIDALKSKNKNNKSKDNDNDKIKKSPIVGGDGGDGGDKSINEGVVQSKEGSMNHGMNPTSAKEKNQSNIQTATAETTEIIKSNFKSNFKSDTAEKAEKVPEINTAKTESIIESIAATDAATDDATTANADADASSDTPIWAPNVHLHEFAPKIVVVGVGGAGTNAVNNMVASGLAGESHFIGSKRTLENVENVGCLLVVSPYAQRAIFILTLSLQYTTQYVTQYVTHIGVEFLALNTDAQHLSTSLSPTRLQIGTHLTSGLGM